MDGEKFLPFIIRSKLYRPQIHGVYLHRQQLIDRLDQRRQRLLTLISAPAGYGKTTLASCWLEASESPCAKLTLDESEVLNTPHCKKGAPCSLLVVTSPN
jgi:LuxR family maltose regulon positive regulatory protein